MRFATKSALLAFLVVSASVGLILLYEGSEFSKRPASAPTGAVERHDKQEASKERVKERVSRVHIPFIANAGQIDPAVAYYAPTFAGTVYVTQNGQIVYSLPGGEGSESGVRPAVKKMRTSGERSGWSLTETPVGGRARPKGERPTSTGVSYFIGNDPSRWRGGLSTFEGVSLGEVWPGISLELRAHGKNVEKLFTVAPSGDPSRIRMSVAGARKLRINEEGGLIVETGPGEVVFTPPAAFQEREGVRHPVKAIYEVRGRQYGFQLGDYDPSLQVVIDPLLQATYLGGSGLDDYGQALAVHPASGDVYVTGYTDSTNFPGTAGGAQATNGGGFDAFVARLNAALTSVSQATYLGGSGGDRAFALAIHQTSGDVYVAGDTDSTNFPGTTGGAQTANGGGSDAFVARLNAALTTLGQATYLGGSDSDLKFALAVHPTSGDVYVAGLTLSADFPGTTGGAQPANGGGVVDAFVTRLNAALTSVSQATYLGGSGNDRAHVLAINPTSGDVYVAGNTSSTNFPGTTGGAQAANGGGGDTYVARLNAALTTLGQATYLGGSNTESGQGLAVHSTSGDVYVAGLTLSTNFPGTAGGAQAANGGNQDVFVARLNSALTSASQATYLGGSGDERALALAILPTSADVYVAGQTDSTNLPGTAGGAQAAIGGGFDGFVARLNAALTSVSQATYLGGSGDDQVYVLAVHPTSSDVYVAGVTASNNFPGTTGGAQPANGGGNDAFVARLSADLAAGPALVLTVTKTADTNDNVCDSDCSLREAIVVANGTPGLDEIRFSIPGTGPHTIAPASPLPQIDDPLIIDGYTQPGAIPNTLAAGTNAVIQIVLDGTAAPATGLDITGGGSTVRGLAIIRFAVGLIFETNGGNVAEGNFVGVGSDGATALGNATFGIYVFEATGSNTIGGTALAARNLISGNPGGVVSDLSGPVVIQNNLIGTDRTGSLPLSGATVGVYPFSGSGDLVGGTAAGAGNVISGNAIGILLQSSGNVIQGNRIGTDPSGTIAVPNQQGIEIDSSASNNLVGGTVAGAANVIAFNGGGTFGPGVRLADGVGNSVLGNSIFSNGFSGDGLGIDLVPADGPNPNDPGDDDTGPNNLQNFPVLTSASISEGLTNVQGTLDSAPSTTFRVEFFSNAACDTSGFGEGQTFLGFADITTDGNGQASFFVTFPPVAAGSSITSTATDPAGNTSEFSQCSTITGPTPTPTPTVPTPTPTPTATSTTPTITPTVTVTPLCGTITLSPASVSTGTVGETLERTFSASGGTAPYTFLRTSGSLPPGLSLSTTGFLSGSPTTPGTYTFTVTATDANGCSGSRTYTTRITCATVTVLPATLVGGVQGTPYSQTLTASGGRAPLTFAVTGGALPSGLALSSAGVLSGTPTATGTFTFTVTATDASGCSGTATYTLSVCVSGLTLSPGTLPAGTVGSGYGQNLAAVGGVPPYAFAVSSGTLPAGVTLSPAGVLSGTPTAAGLFSFTVAATDANGCSGVQTYSLRVCPVVAIAPATLPGGVVGTAYSQTLSASGGTGPYTFTASGSVPPGLTLSASGVLSGTPTQSGSFAFTVTATDFNGCPGLQGYTVVVTDVPPVIEELNLAPADGGNFALSVTGSGFVSGAVAIVNGVSYPTTFISSTLVTVVLPASAVPTTGSITVVVVNPGETGGTSNPASLTFCNPPGTPLNPTIAPAGNPTGPVTATDFLQVRWDPPATGPAPEFYEYRINGDSWSAPVSGTGTLALPRGNNDPITLFVRAHCNAEVSSPEASSQTYSLAPPVANFTFSSARINSPVSFTDTSSPQATSWLWIFDDGATSILQSPTHTFATAGTHRVALIASNGSGSDQEIKDVGVTPSGTGGGAVTSSMRRFARSEAGRWRLPQVQISEAKPTFLELTSRETQETIVYLRFIDSEGWVVLERRLSVAPGHTARNDVSAYGLEGLYTLEVVSNHKIAPVLAQQRELPELERRSPDENP